MEEEFVYLSTPLSHLASKENKRSLGTVFHRCSGGAYAINRRTIMTIKTVDTHCLFIHLKVTPRTSSVSCCIRSNLLGVSFLFLSAWVWAFKAGRASYNLHPLTWRHTWKLGSPQKLCDSADVFAQTCSPVPVLRQTESPI